MTEGEKVLRDPVHGYVYIHDPVFWELLNTREVQRLRRIRQLGTAYLTYPGGEHSRFSHALGTYEVARRILLAFERNGYPVESSWARLVMAAAMLHDIGHGPFSHALEALWGPSHESWGEQVLRSPETEVHRVLAAVDPLFPDAVADVIAKRYPDRLAVSLVSGQLDADRLDYLIRDSVFTGVDYGKFDLDRVLRVILPHQGQIVVKRSGLHTVEAYLLARYFMYWQVYFHPVCRSAEIVLRKALERAQEIARQGVSVPCPDPALDTWIRGHRLDLNQYLGLDDTAVWAALKIWRADPPDPVLGDLARRLLDRHLFRYVDYPESFNPRRFGQIERRVADAGWDPHYYLEVDEAGGVYYDYYVGAEPSRAEPLYLYDGRELVEMSRLSRPLQGIARERERVRRLYFAEQVADIVAPLVGTT